MLAVSEFVPDEVGGPMNTISIAYGGRSSEHDASLSSFANVFAGLDQTRIRATAALYIDRAGRMHIDKKPAIRTEVERLRLPIVSPAQAALELASSWTLNLLHGQEGEDGVFAGWARTHELPGSWGTALGGALGMAKWASGAVTATSLRGEAQVPATHIVRRSDMARGTVHVTIPGPVVIKPGGSGASIKTFMVSQWSSACLDLVADVLTISSTALVQERVDGVEYSVGVLDLPAGPRALPVVRIIPADHGSFFDHVAKHKAGQAIKEFEQSLTTRRLQRIAERLFTVLDGFGMARMDFIVSKDGEPYFLETNTLPGLMYGSIFPAMLREVEMSLTDLVVTLQDADRRRRADELDVEFRYTIEDH